jgi:hypothetical protein
LLAPLISFDVKTPIQAFTDTLPAKLKEAILNHHVLVGMSCGYGAVCTGTAGAQNTRDGRTDALRGVDLRPAACKEVDFVRFNGNHVIRVEVAKMGETPVVFTRNEVEGLMRTDGSPLQDARVQHEDRPDGRRRAQSRHPGSGCSAQPAQIPARSCPTDDKNAGEMKPVRFPKPKPVPQPGDNPDSAPDAQPPADGQSSSEAPQSAPEKPTAQ